MASLFERLKERKLVQWFLAYVTASWVIAQVLDTFVDVVPFLEAIRPTVLVLLLLGMPVVLVLAWYHGEKGQQRVGGRELLVLATVMAVTGGGFAFFDRSSDAGSTVQAPAGDFSPAPAIAVLPAIAAGTDAEELGEGIVSVLSTGLDAVDGWRAVSPRTVRARWQERVPAGESADEATALEIARAAAGRYAVLPTTTVLGSSVRISADVFDLEAPDSAPVAIEVEGNVEALLALADEMALQVLRAVLVEEGEIPDIDLSRTSSDSPEALRAFLRGEVAYRNFELEDARDAFNLALAHDPGFARAHYRLYEVHNWGVTWDLEEMSEHRVAAYEGLERLTEREALVIRGLNEPDRTVRLGLMREAVGKYPDDATAWNLLGERLIHELAIKSSIDEITRTFDRAIELDPFRAVLYGHPVSLAFGERADSARATELVSRFVAAASGVGGESTFDVDPRGGELALELAFGDPVMRAAAWRRLADDVAAGRTETLATLGYLGHPRYWDQFRPILVSAFPYLDSLPGYPGWARAMAFTGEAEWRGRVDQAMTFVGELVETRPGAQSLYGARAMGLPIQTETLDAAFGPGHIVEAAEDWRLALAGWHAADVGRWDDHDRALELLASRFDPEAVGTETEGWWEVVRGYGIWRRGDPDAALEILEDVTGPGRPGTENVMRHLGELYLELQRWSEAELIFNTGAAGGVSTPPLFWSPLARRNLALALEAQGKNAQAVDAYEYFVEQWHDADPELQPMVEEAREAIRRLSGSE